MLEKTEFSIALIQRFNWLFMAVLGISATIVFSWEFAQGILVGSLIANVSFLALKRDIGKIFQGTMVVTTSAALVKVTFFIRYYLRLALVAVVLFFLVRYLKINIYGLLAGLSSVFLSIVYAALSQVMKNYSSVKEAV